MVGCLKFRFFLFDINFQLIYLFLLRFENLFLVFDFFIDWDFFAGFSLEFVFFFL